MPTTAHGLPYPSLTGVTPNVPRDIQALADAAESKLLNRGSVVIATEQSLSGITFGLMATPDVITGLVVPASSIVRVRYFASWKQAVSASAEAAIFIGANQATAVVAGAAPNEIEATLNVNTTYRPLVTDPRYGLVSLNSATAYTGDVTTGQLFGGIATSVEGGGVADFFVTAGTYDVSVKFRTVTGTANGVSAKNRRLYVEVLPF